MVRGRPRHVAGYAADFLFRGGQLRQPVASLSGGERNRLLLARALARPSNLLVLDEPTNDLDMETLDLLEDLLADYDGTLILVSHDRDFIDRLATSTIALDGAGAWSRRRAAGATSSARTRISSRAPPPPTRPRRPRPGGRTPSAKLSYRDERRLAELEADGSPKPRPIAALESRWPTAASMPRSGRRSSARVGTWQTTCGPCGSGGCVAGAGGPPGGAGGRPRHSAGVTLGGARLAA